MLNRLHRHLFYVFLIIVTPIQVLGQDNGLSSFPARTELHSFISLTISDEQFLRGDDNGIVVTVSGELRIARGVARLPAMIMIHGSGGLGSKEQLWSDKLNGIGISTFVIDSFTGRDLVTVNTDQKLLGRLNMVVDAYRALEVLADHPRVDPSRIALMGFSRGGQGTLYAAMTRFHGMWNRSGLSIAAYIPFYPNCATTYKLDTVVQDAPIRIFHGTADDSNPVAPCRRYVDRLVGAEKDVQLIEYADAHHAFDSPTLSSTPIFRPNGQTSGWCSIVENDAGELINSDSGQVFSYEDDCVRPYHIGSNFVAAQSAQLAVEKLLREKLNLP